MSKEPNENSAEEKLDQIIKDKSEKNKILKKIIKELNKTPKENNSTNTNN